MLGHQATGIMDVHDANVRKYGEKKANRMLYWSLAGFILFWAVLVGAVAIFG